MWIRTRTLYPFPPYRHLPSVLADSVVCRRTSTGLLAKFRRRNTDSKSTHQVSIPATLLAVPCDPARCTTTWLVRILLCVKGSSSVEPKKSPEMTRQGVSANRGRCCPAPRVRCLLPAERVTNKEDLQQVLSLRCMREYRSSFLLCV